MSRKHRYTGFPTHYKVYLIEHGMTWEAKITRTGFAVIHIPTLTKRGAKRVAKREVRRRERGKYTLEFILV